MTVGFVPLYDLSNNIEEYMAKSVSHLISDSTRDSNLSPRAKGQRPDIGWGLIWVLYTFWHILFFYCTCIFEKKYLIYLFFSLKKELFIVILFFFCFLEAAYFLRLKIYKYDIINNKLFMSLRHSWNCRSIWIYKKQNILGTLNKNCKGVLDRCNKRAW